VVAVQHRRGTNSRWRSSSIESNREHVIGILLENTFWDFETAARLRRKSCSIRNLFAVEENAERAGKICASSTCRVGP
jgi:hypothetical protein